MYTGPRAGRMGRRGVRAGSVAELYGSGEFACFLQGEDEVTDGEEWGSGVFFGLGIWGGGSREDGVPLSVEDSEASDYEAVLLDEGTCGCPVGVVAGDDA